MAQEEKSVLTPRKVAAIFKALRKAGFDYVKLAHKNGITIEANVIEPSGDPANNQANEWDEVCDDSAKN